MHPSGVDYVDLDAAIRADRPDLLDVARGVGASAARLGAPLEEVLNHLERSHRGAVPPFELVRQTVLTFVDTLHELHLGTGCEDPLTGWCSVSHLRSVLGGMYRAAQFDESDVRETHALLVVEPVVAEPDELLRSLRAIDIGEALRSAFGRDELFARLCGDRFAVLVGRSTIDEVQLRLVTLVLRRVLGVPEPRLWVELLPSQESDLDWVMGALTR